MWRCDNVVGLGEHVKKHVLWFLRYYKNKNWLQFLFIVKAAVFEKSKNRHTSAAV